MKRQSGLTLIEVVAVATLTVLVAIGAMRLLTIFADETNFAIRLSPIHTITTHTSPSLKL